MSKYHFFIGFLVAAFIFPTSVGWGGAPDCLMAALGTDHACCSEQPERPVLSCCSDESESDPVPALCSCSHAPDSPAGPLPVVPVNAPSLVAEMVDSGAVTGGQDIVTGSLDEAWYRGPPGATVPVFLLACAFLI